MLVQLCLLLMRDKGRSLSERPSEVQARPQDIALEAANGSRGRKFETSGLYNERAVHTISTFYPHWQSKTLLLHKYRKTQCLEKIRYNGLYLDCLQRISGLEVST